MTEPDRLAELRSRVAIEEGVSRFSEMLAGGNEAQLRDSAIAIRQRLGVYGSPTLASAIAAQRRAQAERNSRLRFE